MKKTFIAAAALSICLFAASCGNETDPMAGGTTDTTNMNLPASSITPSDNTGSGAANAQSGSMSQQANNANEVNTRNAASGSTNGGVDMKQQDAQKHADTPNNRTGLGQSK